MKQTDRGCNFEVITFDYLYPYFFKKDTLKSQQKCAQQSMILTYQIFCVLNPWSL